MTTDRELLELAAKAAGYVIDSYLQNGGCWVYLKDAAQNKDGEMPIFRWDPRGDDGHAQRLAVALNLQVACSPPGRCEVVGMTDQLYAYEQSESDPCAAARLAIFRAAVAIGNAMP